MTPATEGFTNAGLERLHATVERHVGDQQIPGLVALVARGEHVHVEALGNLAIGDTPVARDSLFRLSSTTKPITAAATLALIEEGLIGLHEPVDRLLPELANRRVLRNMDSPLQDTVPAERAITTRDLLTFTFGFGMALEMFMAATPWPIVAADQELRLATLGPPNPEIQPDPDTWIANLGTLPLIAQPGERWLYNTGASVLGVLLARAANTSFAEVLRTRVFEPLGMHNTSFWTAQPERLAAAYQPTPEGLVVWDQPHGAWSRPQAFADGGAGLLSSADDMLAFARMLMCGGAPVLSAQSVQAMTSDQLTAAQKAHGGLGSDFFNGRSWGYCQAVQDDGAFGWAGGFGSTWLVDPARQLIVIVLSQRMFESAGAPQAHQDIQAAAYAALA
ncbi:MAG TPA: serine hydrolase domain-containing protein [Solirubrobacteraceae bacterium]